jgi:hypothetical protein
MQCHVYWKIITDVLREHTTAIFMVKEYSSALEIEAAHSFQSVGYYESVSMASHP